MCQTWSNSWSGYVGPKEIKHVQSVSTNYITKTQEENWNVSKLRKTKPRTQSYIETIQENCEAWSDQQFPGSLESSLLNPLRPIDVHRTMTAPMTSEQKICQTVSSVV